MSAPIRVLHLEPDPRETERVRSRFQDDGLACEILRVETKEEFAAALRQQVFDLVLCDYDLGGLEALKQVRAHDADLAVITLSTGMLGPEEAVECLKAGATDYVLKQRMFRLGFSVRRVLAEDLQRAALRHAEEDLRRINAELEQRVRQRTAELETANAFVNSVIHHIPYQIIVKRADDLTVVRVNRRVEEMTGRSEQELLGKTMYDFVRVREDADFFTAKDREALALGRELDIPEERLHSPDGKERVLHAKKIPIFGEDGRPRYLLTMSEDVTERKKREREIERLNAALAQRSAEVEAANRAKGTFLATMSHEIRTPMHGMLGMLELLGLTTLAPDQRETLEVVRESGRSLLRIIDDILDFSKIEAGKLDIRPEPVSIPQVVEDVQRVYLGTASSKGLVVRRMVDPRISPSLHVDPVRLRQILSNFVSNAIKFTAEGWVDINVQFRGRADGLESLRFEVKDTGQGIAPEDQRRLFQPFSQALSDAARQRAGGSGLGLVISRQLAEMMGGVVSLASEPGRGTTITLDLDLPIVGGAPGPEAAGARPATESLAPRRAAPSIAHAEAEGTLVLLADDHPVNRMLLLRQVGTLGYAAEAAEDGEQALALWKSGRFGLVITDCHMPRMDGYDLARAIRRLEAEQGRKRVPIVACTANALSGEAQNCFEAGMDDCLVKPVQLAQLVERLDRWAPLPEARLAPSAASAPADASAPAESAIDQALLDANCGGDAAVVREVLAAFRRTCEDDSAGLRQALAAHDAAQVTQFAHRMAGASKMVGALAFAEACARIDRAGRIGDWPAVLAGMPAYEKEWGRLADWFRR